MICSQTGAEGPQWCLFSRYWAAYLAPLTIARLSFWFDACGDIELTSSSTPWWFPRTAGPPLRAVLPPSLLGESDRAAGLRRGSRWTFPGHWLHLRATLQVKSDRAKAVCGGGLWDDYSRSDRTVLRAPAAAILVLLSSVTRHLPSCQPRLPPDD